MQNWSEDFLKIIFKHKIPTKHQLKNQILKASDIFTFNNTKRPENYMKNPDILTSYLTYFVPINLAKIYSILKEFFRHPLISPSKDIKVIDIGCGPSPAILPIFKLFEEGIISISYVRYIGVDLEEKAIEFGREIIERFKPRRLSVNYEFFKADGADIKIYAELKKFKPDIMIFSNSLGEIFESNRLKEENFINSMKSFTNYNDNFTLIIIEPATKNKALKLHELRNNLVRQAGFYPFSPCTHVLPCPAVEVNNWCYEERKWLAPEYLSFLSAIGLQINYLKFSYIILRNDGLNIKDTFPNYAIIVKNTSNLLKEKGKSRVWGCWDGRLIDIERLKRDYIEEDRWLKIKKGCYFSFENYIKLSEKKIRLLRDSSVKILYCPEVVSL